MASSIAVRMNLSFCFEVGKGPPMSIANFSFLWEITSGSSNGTFNAPDLVCLKHFVGPKLRRTFVARTMVVSL